MFIARVVEDTARIATELLTSASGWIVVTPPRGVTSNQSAHFATACGKGIAHHLGATHVALTAIKRASHRIEGLQNDEDFFEYHGPVKQPIIIFDDVTTTGATIGAARKALLKAGVEQPILAICWAYQ